MCETEVSVVKDVALSSFSRFDYHGALCFFQEPNADGDSQTCMQVNAYINRPLGMLLIFGVSAHILVLGHSS